MLAYFSRSQKPVTSVCLSDDGRYALSGSWNDTLKLWDLHTRNCLNTFEGHSSVVESVQLAANMKYALSGSWDKTLKLWSIETGGCLRTYVGHTEKFHRYTSVRIVVMSFLEVMIKP